MWPNSSNFPTICYQFRLPSPLLSDDIDFNDDCEDGNDYVPAGGPGCVHNHSTCSHQEPTMDVFICNLKDLPQLYDVFQG